MKTTDLIPIILYQLVNGDKYGYEIIKQIEDDSKGGIIIKQPTLYSILKKLEQGKLISSYWEDSEIGGKRHYYRLTDSGRAQVDTYPPLSELIRTNNDNAINSIQDTQVNIDINEDENNAKDEVFIKEVDLSYTENIASTSSYDATKEDVDDFNVNTEQVIIPRIDLTTPTTKPVNIFEAMEEYSPTLESSSKLNELDDKLNINEINISDTPGYSIDNSYNSTLDIYNTDKLTSNALDLDETNTKDLSSKDDLVNIENISPITSSIVIENTPSYITSENDSTSSTVDEIKFNNIDLGMELKQEPVSNLEENNLCVNAEEQVPFTSKVEPVLPINAEDKLYNKVTTINNDLFETKAKAPDYSPVVVEDVEQIKYLNYVDFATDKPTIKSRKAITRHIQKMILTCSTLLIMLIASVVLGFKYGFSTFYYVSVGVVGVIILLYPLVLINKYLHLRLKYSTNVFKYNTLTDFLIKLTSFLILSILIFTYNLRTLNNINAVFSLSNLCNFVIPIVFSAGLLIDFIYSLILYKSYRGK